MRHRTRNANGTTYGASCGCSARDGLVELVRLVHARAELRLAAGLDDLRRRLVPFAVVNGWRSCESRRWRWRSR